jgi:hypothetical protein
MHARGLIVSSLLLTERMSKKEKWGIAQLVERWTLDPKVEGSIPSSPAIILTVFSPVFMDCLPPENIGVLKKEFNQFRTKWLCDTPITRVMLAEGLKPGDLFVSGYLGEDE